MGLLGSGQDPVLSGLLSMSPEQIRTLKMQQAMQAGGGRAPSVIGASVPQQNPNALGEGLAGLGQGLAAIGKMGQQAKQREAFEAAVAKLPPEQQAIARLNPEAFAQENAKAMFRSKESMKPVPLGQGEILVDPTTGKQIAAGQPKADDFKLYGSPDTGWYTLDKDENGRPKVNMLINPAGSKPTSLQQDYLFAVKNDGYRGSLVDFIRATREKTLERVPSGYEPVPGGEGVRPIPGGPADPNAPTRQPAAVTTPTGSTVGGLGVPVPDTDPTEGLPAPQRAALAAKIREDAIKEFAASKESVDQAKNVNERLGRFVQLLDGGLNTGGQYRIPGAKTIGATMSDSVAEAQSIVDMMTPMMRQGMPGAASDRDVAMFRGATVGLDKPEQANKNIAAGLMASRQNLIERDQFMQTYFDQNKHLQGADRAWQRYLDANPIFDLKAPDGSYKLNDKRASWRDWFSGSAQGRNQPAAPAAAAPSAMPDLPPLPPGFVVSP